MSNSSISMTQEVAGDADPSSLQSGATIKVQFNALEVAYRTKAARIKALGPMSMGVADGEFISVVGPSGCGKSTLIRVVAGLIAPTAGDVDINLASSNSVSISTVFQDYGILPWKTVGDNVAFALRSSGTPKKDAVDRTRYWLDRVGLQGFEDLYPKQLSGGMRQRVAIARSFAVEPEILLLDEPFASLDAQMREVMQGELLALCSSGSRTVVLITHSLEEAMLLSNRVAVMSARPGRIIDLKQMPFGQEHGVDVRDSPEFAAIRSELWEHLRAEVSQNDKEGRS